MAKRRLFPLFWRIFLLIWLAMAVTVLASNLATRQLIDQERQAIERQEGLRTLAQEAIRIRQTRGGRALRRFLHQQGLERDLHIVLLEPGRRNEHLPPEVRDRMEPGWHRPRPAVFPVGDGYRLVAWPRIGGEGWLDPRLFRLLELIIGFVLITLACWWLARRISRPLRHMEHTARQIAGGDPTLRVSDRIANRLDEIGALATAFNDMTDRLCHLLERQKHLLRDISHDLRTPLTRQRIAIELASDTGADPGLMASILRQNERLEAMTAQILTLYQVIEEGGEMSREAVDPVRVLQQVLQDAADYAEQRGVDCRLEVRADCRLVSVLGDPHLLQRAFDNILQNALDHTPPGRVVVCRCRRTDDRFCLEVQDQGPGVADAALAHLFEPFYRTDEARSGQGWGLGLAIARDIVVGHDGAIEAANGQDGGLVVRIALPVFVGD
ncbi:MAG: HAMP domain-containing sensor histidine kinase [Marinobacter sp.]|uniref:sensor histidine kinase n=1 Tax=Marinobacter sp. TaxID=50741 RepID=UPI00299D81E8|nr:HAMP domain-containing sensor histidine kinase [Marinobacter sp.]MDX1756558.1 HAMP domain-containing sensor histidine kinase [Marinobacter sp.]